jgi:molybdopterin converting factor small subunit
MIVRIPGPLHSYTQGRSAMELEAATLGELLQALDARFPGIHFRMVDEQARIRAHIRFYADGAPLTSLAARLESAAEVLIVAALSGG